jgi:hypothetical protein
MAALEEQLEHGGFIRERKHHGRLVTEANLWSLVLRETCDINNLLPLSTNKTIIYLMQVLKSGAAVVQKPISLTL